MIKIKVVTLALLLTGTVVGAGISIYINNSSATTDAAAPNSKSEHSPVTLKHVDPINTSRNKGY